MRFLVPPSGLECARARARHGPCRNANRAGHGQLAGAAILGRPSQDFRNPKISVSFGWEGPFHVRVGSLVVLRPSVCLSGLSVGSPGPHDRESAQGVTAAARVTVYESVGQSVARRICAGFSAVRRVSR